MVIVQYIEQISKPDQPGEPDKLTNEQKKAQAFALLKRYWPDANVEEIDQAIEAAVYAAKHFGVKMPEIQLKGDLDILDKWDREQAARIDPEIPVG